MSKSFELATFLLYIYLGKILNDADKDEQRGCRNEKLGATEAFSAEDWLLKPQYLRRVN